MKRRIVIPLSGLLLVTATYIFGWSTLFTVSSVEISGTKTQLDAGVVKGEKLARIESRAIAAKFENLDWVADAKVSRNWINGKVTIEITERTPVAIFNNIVIDSTGKSFALRGKPSTQLVQIQAADLSSAIDAVTFFSSLPSDIKLGLTVVKLRGTGAFVMEVNNAGQNLEIRWGDDSENELKYKVYKAIIALPENAAIKRVDVSAPHAPIVK
jgi:cell division septal protein FtsQ